LNERSVSAVLRNDFRGPHVASAGASTASRPSAAALTVAFARQCPLRVFLISIAVLVPCFWHRRIVASDLGSHLYNAWLAQLIRGGHAPGLYVASQHTNVLFDYLLDIFGRFFSLATTEKFVVAFCVQIFFWGMFAIATASAKRPPWLLIPAMAMFTYGYTFHMGFFNYYLAIGFSFWAIAIAWHARGISDLWALLPLAVLVELAHPLGLAWLVAGCIYVYAATRMPGRYHGLLVLLSFALIALAHYYIWHHDVIEAQSLPFYYFNGADQLLLFGDRYKYVEYAFLVFSIVALARDLWPSKSDSAPKCNYAIPGELYVILIAAVIFLPEGIRFANKVPALALLSGRLTSVTAAVVCCILAAMRPRRWHLAGYVAVAAIFFAMVYQDTGVANTMEDQVEQLERTLPPNQRVLGTIPPLPGSRILIQHMLDRACIGYCFSYGNYEPSTGLFRVRATPGNPYVMADFDDAADMEEGIYEVQADDLPAYGIFPCDPGGAALCIRPLKEGETVDPRVSPDDR
jgi:hypothetical protein